MRKQEFLDELKEKLYGLPKQEINERLTFYSEMLEDMIEEGVAEEEAVFQIGNPDKIAKQIIAEIPFIKIIKEKFLAKRQYKAWEIVFLAVGAPIWLSLILSAVAVVFSLYVSLWAVIVSSWAVFISLGAGFLGGAILTIFFMATGHVPTGFAMLGAGLVCVGLAILAFHACKEVTKGVLLLTKKLALVTKKVFVKKEAEHE